ncbi:MAG: hypothetical protein OXI62_07200 [Chloroflexota bacterium]|nr:hypothetical protein [Chloroflexota bacterium]MCY3581917.1 hypothetical protein [Chloroflexota bacterium]MDE2650484.1 hypothetical protein [Chloroflexota bacterium]
MVKRFPLVALCLLFILSAAPFALADADCDADFSHYARAVQLHDMGDYARALRYYNCALAADPANPTIPLLIENLREDIASAPHAWSTDATVCDASSDHVQLGQSAYARGDEDSALAQLQCTLLVNPGDAEAAELMGHIHINRGNTHIARYYYDRAATAAQKPAQPGFIMPDWLTPYEVAPATNQPARSLTFFPQRVYVLSRLTIQPPPPASQDAGLGFADYIDFANWFSKRGEWQRVAKSLERALELQPYHDDIRCRLGMVYQSLGDDSAALAQFDYVISRDPSHICTSGNRRAMLRAANAAPQNTASAPQEVSPAQPIVERALTYHDANKLFAAANTFIEALALDPAYHQARCELATIFSEWSNYGRALREFERILAHQPADACAIAGRLATVEKLLDMYVPLVVEDYFYHAREYLRIDAWSQAREALELGLTLEPMRPYMRCQLGMVAWQLGDTNFALAQFDRILMNDSQDACAASNRDALMQSLRGE